MADFAQDVTDRELIEFFSVFDDVTASESLKNATLGAIFQELDAEDDASEAQTVEPAAPQATASTDGTATLTVVEDADGARDETAVSTDVKASRAQLTVVNGGADTRRKSRRHGLRLRVAAAVAAVAIAAAGGVAYAVPSSYVQVTEGGTTIDLGVNLFGVTVTAQADSDEGRAVLDEIDVRHLGFEDALARVIDKMGERGEGDGSVRVEVSSTFDGLRNGLDNGAAHVIDDRGLERGSGARATGVASNTTPEGQATGDTSTSGGAVAPSAQGGDASAAGPNATPTTPAAPDGATPSGDDARSRTEGRQGDASSDPTGESTYSPTGGGDAPSGGTTNGSNGAAPTGLDVQSGGSGHAQATGAGGDRTRSNAPNGSDAHQGVPGGNGWGLGGLDVQSEGGASDATAGAGGDARR